MKLIIIYKLTCAITNMSYIGQTKNGIIARIRNHISANSLIGYAIRKYEIENFKLEIIWEAINKAEANIVEKAAIYSYQVIHPNGYNLSSGGEGGGVPSSTTLKKMSERMKGENNPMYGKVTRGFLGHHHSKESNEKNRQAHLGHRIPGDVRKKISESMKGINSGENNPMRNPKTVLKQNITRFKNRIIKLENEINSNEKKGDT